MKPIGVIKFDKNEDQFNGSGLDDSIVPFWHVIDETGNGEYTACGQATTEYSYKFKRGKITCAHCLSVVKFYKELGK